MPAVKGLGVLAVSTEESEDDLEDMETRLKRIEERKRIQREIERELADELDAAEDDEDGGLMERDPIPSVMPPRMPTPILPTISIGMCAFLADNIPALLILEYLHKQKI